MLRIVKKTLLITTKGNVWRTLSRIYLPILGCRKLSLKIIVAVVFCDFSFCFVLVFFFFLGGGVLKINLILDF